MLLILLPSIPLLGAFALLVVGDKDVNMPFIAGSVTLTLAGWGLRGVFRGEQLTCTLPFSGPYSPTFQADILSCVFVLLAAFLWWAVSIYTPEYMKKEGGARSFDISTLLTLSAVLGVFLAGDLFTMLLFFELMTISSYFWVIHRRNEEAIRAGYFYLFFSIFGGLLLALGIVFITTAANGLPALGRGSIPPVEPRIFAWGLAAIIAGFGIKAGMVPLHLWLPHAHSVSPTPASALLSGLLIKVGAYGLIRAGELAGWGLQWGNTTAWIGYALTVLGSCTMLLGVIAALLQSDAKRLLAYHSVSQMGYIILGLGICLSLGNAGGLGLIGAIYHVINHALFKAALFLGVGVIYVRTGETNLYNLGGLLRSFPVTAVLVFLAVLGITGAPGLNGYASKTILHHAVTAASETGLPLMVWAERLFVLVGVGTATSFAKLYYLIFLGRPAKVEISECESRRFHVSMVILAIVMVGIGLLPGLIPQKLAASSAQAWGTNAFAAIQDNLSFWNTNDVVSAFVTLGLGAVACLVGLATGAFHWAPPSWLTLEGLGRIACHNLVAAWRLAKESCHSAARLTSRTGRAIRLYALSARRRTDDSTNSALGGITPPGISADAALLMATLAILIACYACIDFRLPNLRLPSSFPAWNIFQQLPH
jgi:formate hydrogenlyase subunit 3/multisubunit Na+/H+ antiporter MnhD subunit